MEGGEKCHVEEEGRFASIDTQELLCIEYPAMIFSVENMLNTLGGITKISRAYIESKERLQLKYRPRDPSCKAAFGQLHKSKGLLLRVKRKRKRGGVNREPGPWLYEQSILGIVVGVYRFDTMMDFQYLTPPSLQSSYKHLFGRELLNRDEPFFPLPKVFTRIDTPGNYYFRGYCTDPNVDPGEAVNQDGKGACDTLTRKQRLGYGLAALYNSKTVPCEPIHENKVKCDKFLEQFPANKKNVEMLKSLFEEKPLWQRRAMIARCKLKVEFFKQILPNIAYYWINGPWGRLWCKLGYDPRLHPETYKYQVVECRIKDPTEHVVQNRRKKKILPATLLLKKSRLGNIFEEANQPIHNAETDGESSEFQPDKVPTKTQVRYQLCDIRLAEVDEIMRDIHVDQDTKCTEQDGFLPEGTLQKLRDILRNRLIELMKEEAEKNAASSNTTDTVQQSGETREMDVETDNG